MDKFSAAHKHGLSSGDKIVEVNGISLNKKTSHNEAVKVINFHEIYNNLLYFQLCCIKLFLFKVSYKFF